MVKDIILRVTKILRDLRVKINGYIAIQCHLHSVKYFSLRNLEKDL